MGSESYVQGTGLQYRERVNNVHQRRGRVLSTEHLHNGPEGH